MPALRVLIIEDEAMIAMLCAEVLESLGHETCGIAATEAAAILAARDLKPDLVIADEHLEEGSGAGAMAIILAERQSRGEGKLAHIFIGGDRVSRNASALALRLQKPFTMAQLVAAIRLALAGASA